MTARHNRPPVGGLDFHGMRIHGDIEQTVRHTEHEQTHDARPVAGQLQQCADRCGGQEPGHRADGSGAEAADERTGPKNGNQRAHASRQHRQRHFGLAQTVQAFEGRHMHTPSRKRKPVQEEVNIDGQAG
jgi:hypothetical protein